MELSKCESLKTNLMMIFIHFILLSVVSFARADECSPPVNEYPVCFPLYHNITISEALGKNENVKQLNCTDPDGGKLKFSIADGNTKGFFTVDKTGMLMTNKRMDAEGKDNPYMLYIEVTDDGMPRLTTMIAVTIIITSINDEPPEMQNLPTDVSVSENTAVGTIIATCTLYDADSARQPEGQVRVEIKQGNQDGLFRLDARTCALSIEKRLDYETSQNHTLLLRAYELDVAAPLTSLQNITIHVLDYNDNQPKCADYVILLTIPENTAPGTVVTSLNCSDVDVSDQLRYTVATGSSNKLSVNTKTGRVTVAAASDFETEPRNYDVIVLVHDVSSQPMTVTVVINVQVTDVDDHVPYFANNVIQLVVSEDEDLGHIVWTLSATDDDSDDTVLSDVTYSLTSATRDCFSLHPKTGVLEISRLLDSESFSHVELVVAVHSSDRSNNTSTALVNITITDTNDNRPIFSQALYICQVIENAPVGTSVCLVNVTDNDVSVKTKFSFSISTPLFSIHAKTGLISLAGVLDFEVATSHTFVVTATDDVTSSALTSQALVTVEVVGVNEWSPVWVTPASNNVVVSVSENTSPGTRLLTASARDDDDGDDGLVTYRMLQPPDATSPFLLNRVNRDVILRSKLDRETVDKYVMVLEARDSPTNATLALTSTVTLTLSVTDYNDNAPVCRQEAPVIVKGDTAPGDTVVTLNCTDLDLVNGQMTFVKLSGDASGVFEVVSGSGEVRLFRLPTQPQYELVIEVRDGGSPELSTRTTLTLVVENAFEFTNLPDIIHLTEDTDVGRVLFQAQTNGSLLLSFFTITNIICTESEASPNFSCTNTVGDLQPFFMEPSTGEVVLTTTLDRERIQEYEIVVTARTVLGHSATSTLTVSVQDVNDNVPVIISGAFNISVMEDVGVPHALATFSARDDDLQENGTVVFRIASGNQEGRFALTPDGELSVVAPLDVETTQLYKLIIAAEDGGIPPLRAEKHVVILVRNVDEFIPQFTTTGQDLDIALPEDTPIGATVVHVTARDSDVNDDVTYDVISGNDRGDFFMGRTTGSVMLVKLLDRELTSSYYLVVRATNNNLETADCVINVTVTDVNDNAPVFSSSHYAFDVIDKSPADTVIGDVTATDPDEGVNAEVDVTIVSGDVNGLFAVSGTTIKTTGAIDMSVQSSYTLTVRASDGGTPALWNDVTIYVTVVPENMPPRFLHSSANVTVPDNSLTGAVIFDFQATGAGATEGATGDVIYNMTSGANVAVDFHLNALTGELYVVKDLDYEQDSVHTVTVRATHRVDDSLYDVMTLTVHVENVNDVTPTFSLSYAWDVNEGVYVNNVVGTVSAVDTDIGQFGQISYALSGDVRFSVDETSGTIVLNGQVLYSDDAYFSLLVTATDQAGASSRTGSTTVMIHVNDVNDHVPSFPDADAEVTVSESAGVGTVVAAVMVQDGDFGNNSKITCSFYSGNEAGHFNIDPSTCVLTTATSLDAESISIYTLTLTATDAGQPPLTGTTSLTVHVIDNNDNPPSFAQNDVIVSVLRTASQGSDVMTVTAVDRDSGRNGEVTYSIRNGSDNGHFAFDPYSGHLTTATPLTYADDANTLLVTATDRGYPSLTGTMTVTVHVLPALGTPPANVTWTVLENSAIGTVAGDLASEIADNQTVGYSISSGNYRSSFSITPSGMLTVAAPLDRETYPQYQLAVQAQKADGGSDVMIVHVLLSDVNDNAPVFADIDIGVTVVEHLAPGNVVARLTVTDLDEGVNAEVTLTFTSNLLCDVYFSISPDGSVAIKKSLEYKNVRSLTCKVVAKDSGSPALTSTATLTFTVVDVEEEMVEVVGSSNNSSVYVSLESPYNAANDRLVYALSATDFGLTLGAGDNLTFISAKQGGVFSVGMTTGEIRVQHPELLYDKSRYLQWVVGVLQQEAGSGTQTTGQLVALRVDTFDMTQHIVAVTYDVSSDYLQNNRLTVKEVLQAQFSTENRVEILEIREETSAAMAKRRLLASQCVVLIYVVADRPADTVGGFDTAKVFLSQEQLLQVLQLSSDGTPVSSLSGTDPRVLQVMPYYDDLDPQVASDWLETTEGVAILVVVPLAVVLCAAVLLGCCWWRHRKNQKGHDKLEETDRGSSIAGSGCKDDDGDAINDGDDVSLISGSVQALAEQPSLRDGQEEITEREVDTIQAEENQHSDFRPSDIPAPRRQSLFD